MNDEAKEPQQDQGATKTSAGSPLYITTALIALAALGIAAWGAWQIQALRTLPAELVGEQNQLADVARRLDQLIDAVKEQEQATDDLEASLEQSLADLADLPLRLDEMEGTLANLPGVDREGRASWLKTEALYYMRIANAQTMLSGDPQVAAKALELADDKLRETGDPSLARVRTRLREEITALRSIPEIDRVGISARLQALAGSVDDWPLRSIAPDSFTPQPGTTSPGSDAWERFVETIKNVFASIVSIRETSSAPLRQLSNVEAALVVESIRAELQVARISFASGNNELFRQSLARAQEQTELYFDTDVTIVQTAIVALAELQATELPTAMPDISGSMAMLLAAPGRQ